MYQFCAGHYIQPTVLELCFGPFFPSFPSQAVEFFLSSTGLGHFYGGPKSFLFGGKICILWPLLTYSHSVFYYEILPGLSCWLSTARHKYSSNYVDLQDYYMDFQIVSGASWLQSILKLLYFVKEIRYLTNKQSFG